MSSVLLPAMIKFKQNVPLPISDMQYGLPEPVLDLVSKVLSQHFVSKVNNVLIANDTACMDSSSTRGNPVKIEKKLEAGNEINSRCLKCKDVTNHTIVAMVDGKVAKVLCNVCGGRHNYRPEKPEGTEGAKKKTPRASSVSAKLAKAEALFDELISGRDSSVALPYAMTDIFKKGDLLDHPSFGLGVVIETILPDKIEVLFRQESKLLICGRLCR